MTKTTLAILAGLALASCNPLGAIDLTIEARNSVGALSHPEHYNKLFVIINAAEDGRQLTKRQYPGDQDLPGNGETFKLGIGMSDETPEKIEIEVLLYNLEDPSIAEPPGDIAPVASAVARATFTGGKLNAITVRAVAD